MQQLDFNITEFAYMKKKDMIANVKSFIERAECDSINIAHFAGSSAEDCAKALGEKYRDSHIVLRKITK